jgi:hypothetical protein
MATAPQIRDLITQTTSGTLRAVRNPGTVTLARGLKPPES